MTFQVAEQTNTSTYEFGQIVENNWIYLTTCQLDAETGKGPNIFLNLFAAPENLPIPFEIGKLHFKDVAKEVGGLKNWHGSDGFYCENANVLYQSLKDGSALGKWFIPTAEMLNGTGVGGAPVLAKHIFDLQNIPDLAKTFPKGFYISSTEMTEMPLHMFAISPLSIDHGGVILFPGALAQEKRGLFRCRPCRAELVK